MPSYTPGDRVRFVDTGNVSSDSDELVVTEGMVNGPAIEANDRVYVPVFTERDNEREATTVYVDQANIMGPAS